MGQGSSCDLSCENLYHERPFPLLCTKTSRAWLAGTDRVLLGLQSEPKGADRPWRTRRPLTKGLILLSALLDSHHQTKPDLYQQNILTATGRIYPLTKPLGKPTPKRQQSLLFPPEKSLPFKESLKNSPEGTAYLTARWFANAQANTPAGK